MPALPRDLEAAHQGLKRWVARALEQYEEERWFPDRREGRDKIRRFVDVFCEIPRARAELDHRACYAGEQTADGTAYAHAMSDPAGGIRRENSVTCGVETHRRTAHRSSERGCSAGDTSASGELAVSGAGNRREGRADWGGGVFVDGKLAETGEPLRLSTYRPRLVGGDVHSRGH